MLNKCKSAYSTIFFRQFLDIGTSAGSLLGEAICLFRTFQRLSAVREFSVRLSNDCLKMFKWADDLIDVIYETLFHIKPLTDFEIFSIYVFVIPLTLLNFISSLYVGLNYAIYLILYFGITCLTSGSILISNEEEIGIYILVISIVIMAVFIVSTFVPNFAIIKTFFDLRIFFSIDNDSTTNYERISFTYSFISTSIVFTITMFPIASIRHEMMILVICISLISIFVVFILEIFNGCLFKIRMMVNSKLINFILNCFSLLIIPSTNYFINILSGGYRKRWECYCAYVFISLLIPIVNIVIMITSENPDIKDKYKNTKLKCFKPYYYVELIDIIKQVAFSLTTEFGYTFESLCIEIFWFLFILITLPYKNKSDYVLTFGSSFVVIIGTSAGLYSETHGTKVFSFEVTLFFVILACIPAIASLYVFFIYDFDISKKDKSSDVDSQNDEIDSQSDYSLSSDLLKIETNILIRIVSPISWIIFGFNIMLLFYKGAIL